MLVALFSVSSWCLVMDMHYFKIKRLFQMLDESIPFLRTRLNLKSNQQHDLH